VRFLGLGDYAVIVAYFAILIGIGAYFRRKAAASLEDYFLAGRKMPWWALGLSQMTFWFDMTGTMIITSFLFLLGPRGIYVEFRGGAGLVLVFLMLWAGKWHRRSGVITGAEWMIYRFGHDFWGHFARLMMVVSQVILGLALLAYSFKGAGLFLSMFLPFSPLVCSLLMLILTGLYTIESGFYGVVFSDIFQSLCIVIGVGLIVAIAVSKIAGVGDLGALAASVTGNPNWLSAVPQWKTHMPPGYEQYSFLFMMMLFYLGKTVVQGLGVGTDPRYFGAKSDRDCGRLSFLAGWMFMLRWPLMMSFTVLGLILVKNLFPDQAVLAQAAALIKSHAGNVAPNQWPELLAKIMNHPGAFSPDLISGLRHLLGQDWGSKLSLLSYYGTVDPERILPAVLLLRVPMGLRGLLLVALLAAAMSTFNAIINATTAFLTRDVYQGYIRPRAKNKELIYVSYGFGALVMAVGFATAYSTRSINDIWGWLTMGLVGGTMIPTVLRLYWWRFNGSGFALGTLLGLVGALTQRIFLRGMVEWQQFLYMFAVGTAAALIATYIRPPTERGVLEHFYRTTKPFGLWGPLRGSVSAEEAAAMSREHKHDLISLPFALSWQFSMLMLPLLLIIRQYRSSAVVGTTLAAALIGLYFFWYRKLPPA
jgi:SSS family solute:Na+ symporter